MQEDLYKRIVIGVTSGFTTLFFVSCVLLFYFWVGTAGSFKFDRGSEISSQQYEWLAEGFLSGKVSLSIEPSKELISLPNPYDPNQNAPHRIRDLSYYKGKYYLYHGPTPVLLLYAPYKLITGSHISNYLVGCLFISGAFIWAVLIILHLKNNYFKNLPLWILLLTMGIVGFGNYAPYFLLMPFHHEIAELCGLFFLIGSLYFFSCVLTNVNSSFIFYALGSLFLGLAFGSRAFLILLSIVFPIIFFKIYKENKNNLKLIILRATFLLLPFTFCLFIVGIYNYLRFENPFEFGIKYQLAYFDMIRHPLFDPAVLLLGLYTYFLYLPVIDVNFPFIHLNGTCPSFPNYKQMINYLPTVGIFPGVPFIFLILFSPVFYFITKHILKSSGQVIQCKARFPIYHFLMFILTSLILLFYVSGFPSPALRYGMPATTPLILASFIVWSYFDSLFRDGSSVRFYLRVIALLLGIYCIYFGMTLGIDSWSGRMKWSNTRVYKKVERFLTHPVIQFTCALKHVASYTERGFKVINPGIIGVTYNKIPSKNPMLGDLFSPDDGEILLWFDGRDWTLLKDSKNKFLGPIKMKLRFRPIIGAREPLLTTGVFGSGDVIYVSYLSSNEASFGIDHIWSGGEISDVVKIDPGSVHELDISLGSFYFPLDFNEFKSFLAARTKEGAKAQNYLKDLDKLRSEVRIRFDGKEILRREVGFYSTTWDQILFGQNMIVNTFPPSFTGEILEVRKAGVKIDLNKEM